MCRLTPGAKAQSGSFYAHPYASWSVAQNMATEQTTTGLLDCCRIRLASMPRSSAYCCLLRRRRSISLLACLGAIDRLGVNRRLLHGVLCHVALGGVKVDDFPVRRRYRNRSRSLGRLISLADPPRFSKTAPRTSTAGIASAAWPSSSVAAEAI